MTKCGNPWIVAAAMVTALACCIALPGCTPQQPTGNIQMPDSLRESARMLLGDGAFKTICLEVDCVEGAEPPDGAVDALADFLRETCRKPVSVVMGKPIPKADAAGMPPTLIAVEHMSGPAAGDPNAAPAYVYAFLFRGPGDWKQAGWTRRDYPCSMFIDMATIGLLGRAVVRFGLKHEAGHMLGLCANTAHGDGLHCSDKSCLMYCASSITRTFLGLQRGQLCRACMQDLEEMRKSAQPTRLAFKGPFLVRQEHGYFVARLPGVIHVEAGKLDDFDWQQVLSVTRSQVREMKKNDPKGFAVVCQPNGYVKCTRWCDTKDAYLRNQPAILAACKDEDSHVRRIAREIKAELDRKFAEPATSAPARRQMP